VVVPRPFAGRTRSRESATHARGDARAQVRAFCREGRRAARRAAVGIERRRLSANPRRTGERPHDRSSRRALAVVSGRRRHAQLEARLSVVRSGPSRPIFGRAAVLHASRRDRPRRSRRQSAAPARPVTVEPPARRTSARRARPRTGNVGRRVGLCLASAVGLPPAPARRCPCLTSAAAGAARVCAARRVPPVAPVCARRGPRRAVHDPALPAGAVQRRSAAPLPLATPAQASPRRAMTTDDPQQRDRSFQSIIHAGTSRFVR